MPMARALACSFRRTTVADITLCGSFNCPLRGGCKRGEWDGRQLPLKQSREMFTWLETPSGSACQHLVPRAEDSK